MQCVITVNLVLDYAVLKQNNVDSEKKENKQKTNKIQTNKQTN